MISKEDRLKYTIGTLAVEGLTPSEEALQLCSRMADGEISANEAIAEILKKYDISPGTVKK